MNGSFKPKTFSSSEELNLESFNSEFNQDNTLAIITGSTGNSKIYDKIKDSDFYRAIRINYPNARDIDNARTAGKAPGGKIVIHGLPNTMTAERVGHPVLDLSLIHI